MNGENSTESDPTKYIIKILSDFGSSYTTP